MHDTDLLRGGFHRHFDGLIVGIRVDPKRMKEHPQPSPIRPPGGNWEYRDLSGASWHLARRTLAFEELLITKLENASSYELVADARRRMPAREMLLGGLDLGVASAVQTISAAGGTPVTCCNGGAFGGFHAEDFPLVAFHWPRRLVPVLEDCVVNAGLSMWVHPRGELVIAADTIRRMLIFATEMHVRQGVF